MQGNQDRKLQHVVFDFAEKALRPQLMRQPGQLFFVIGLKFDLFDVHNSKLANSFMFGFPECEWSNTKDASSVFSMLRHYMHCEDIPKFSTLNFKTLRMHADSCSIQSKNKFVLFYLHWLILTRSHNVVTLDFIVTGLTKNVVEGAFEHVKRKLKSSDARTTRKMMKFVELSSTSTRCIAASLVSCRL